jgi:rhodanese-related sulfurtransferase
MSSTPKMLAGIAVLAAAGLALLGEPTIDDRLEALRPELEEQIQAGAVHVPPAELRDLIYFANFGLRILDLRSEAEFNLFHLPQSMRVRAEQLRQSDFVRALPKQTVFVLVSNDGKQALASWKEMRALGGQNAYVLTGGVEGWLQVYGPQRLRKTEDAGRSYSFEAALGARHPEADPGPPHENEKPVQRVVKPLGKVKRKAGGCG